MRRTTSLGIVLLGVALAHAGLTNTAGAKERVTLSSLVGRLLKFKKSQPVEPETEPPAVKTTAPVTRYEPQAQVPPSAERPQPSATNMQAPRLREANAKSLLYPPLPPAVNQAWVHPPDHQQELDDTTEEVLALNRNAGSGESSRRGFQTPPSRASATTATHLNPANSPEFAQGVLPVNSMLQVRHVAKMAVAAVKGLPSEGLSAEPELVGNTPAEVRNPVNEEREEIEPALPAKRMEIAQVPEVRLPASTLPPVFQKVRGRIAAIDVKTGVIRVDLLEGESLPTGAKIQVYHQTQAGQSVAVHLRVLDSVVGVAAAQLIDGATLDSIAPGDKTIAWKRSADK